MTRVGNMQKSVCEQDGTVCICVSFVCMSARSRTCGTAEAEEKMAISVGWVQLASLSVSNLSLDRRLEYVHLAR